VIGYGAFGTRVERIPQVRAFLDQTGYRDVPRRRMVGDASTRVFERLVLAMEDAGAFALVLEVVPREIARQITESLSIPTIGIGAGADCDIQVMVLHDMLGLSFLLVRISGFVTA
jgi:ketopantoate hydroxymethyltransferase